MITIGKEFFEYKNIIYFLYYWEELVYIWESSIGVSRAFAHRDKIYNSVKIKKASSNSLDRKNEEWLLISEHRPKYNKKVVFCKPWFILLDTIRAKLKAANKYNLSYILKGIVKNNCDYYIEWNKWYVKFYQIEAVLSLQYNFSV